MALLNAFTNTDIPAGAWLSDGATITLGGPVGLDTTTGVQTVTVGAETYTNVTSVTVNDGTTTNEQSIVVLRGDGLVRLLGNIEGTANADVLIGRSLEGFVLMWDGSTIRFSRGADSDAGIIALSGGGGGGTPGPAGADGADGVNGVDGQDGAGVVTIAAVQTGAFTAAISTGYPLDLSAAGATSDTAITLPVGTANESIVVYDQTRALTDTRTATLSGQRIEGDAAGSLVLDVAGIEAVLTWRDATYGYAVHIR